MCVRAPPEPWERDVPFRAAKNRKYLSAEILKLRVVRVEEKEALSGVQPRRRVSSDPGPSQPCWRLLPAPPDLPTEPGTNLTLLPPARRLMFSASLTFPDHRRHLLLPHSAPPASPLSSNSLALAGFCTSAMLFPLPGNLSSLMIPWPAPSLPVPAQCHQSSPLTTYVK